MNDNYWGSIRIHNPKTLQRWIDNGEYEKLINEGYKFYVGCGRFRKESCTCTKCRTRNRPELVKVLDNYNRIHNSVG